MTLRRSTIVLGVLLAISLVGNAWQFMSAIGGAVAEFYNSRYQQLEIASLRTFSERLAAGEKPRAILESMHGQPDGEGWIVASGLRVKLDGERLVKLCGSMTYEPDGCADDVK